MKFEVDLPDEDLQLLEGLLKEPIRDQLRLSVIKLVSNIPKTLYEALMLNTHSDLPFEDIVRLVKQAGFNLGREAYDAGAQASH